MEYLNNEYIFPILVILVISYGSMAKYDLPPAVSSFFTNNIVRLIIIALIAYLAVHDIKTAIIVSIAYMATFLLLSKYEFAQGVSDIENFYSYRTSLRFKNNYDQRYQNPLPTVLSENMPLAEKGIGGDYERCDPTQYREYPYEQRYYGGPGCQSFADLSGEYYYPKVDCNNS